MQLWDSLNGLLTKRTAERVRDYEGLVRSVAAGEKTDPILTIDVLEKAGKSIGDLRAAVEQIHRRARLAREYAKLPTIRAELKQIASRCEEMRAAAEELRAAQQTEYAAMAPRELALTNEERRLVFDVENELLQTASPEALANREAATAAVRELENQRAELVSTVQDIVQREGPLAAKRHSPWSSVRPSAEQLEGERRDRDATFLENEAAIETVDREIAKAKTVEEHARLKLLA